jgi:hypothetical protein
MAKLAGISWKTKLETGRHLTPNATAYTDELRVDR